MSERLTRLGVRLGVKSKTEHTQGSLAVLCSVSLVHMARNSTRRMSEALLADELIQASANRISSAHSLRGWSSARRIAVHSWALSIRLCR